LGKRLIDISNNTWKFLKMYATNKDIKLSEALEIIIRDHLDIKKLEEVSKKIA